MSVVQAQAATAITLPWRPVKHTGFPYNRPVRTVIETPTFKRQADAYWVADERLAFFAWLAANPEAGDVIPGADGARKVRWSLPGSGKRSGVRVIYFNETEDGTLLLVMMYAKAQRENVSSGDIKRAM